MFDNLLLGDELFANVLGSLKTCVLGNNDFFEKLVSSLELPVTFDKKFKATSVPFLLPDFFPETFYIDVILNQNKVAIVSQLLVKNPK